MRITRLELQNIGPFEHQIFDFNPVKSDDKAEIHIFSGVNGSGKSTVLYALASGFDPFSSVRNRFRFTDRRSCLRIRNSGEHEELILQYEDSGELRYISSPQKISAVIYKGGIEEGLTLIFFNPIPLLEAFRFIRRRVGRSQIRQLQERSPCALPTLQNPF